jgi:hypothetical protein
VLTEKVEGVGLCFPREFLYRLEHAYDLVHDEDTSSPYDKIKEALKGCEGFSVVIGNQLFEDQVDSDEDTVIRYPTDLLILSADNGINSDYALVVSHLLVLFEQYYPDNVCDISSLRVDAVSTERMCREGNVFPTEFKCVLN